MATLKLPPKLPKILVRIKWNCAVFGRRNAIVLCGGANIHGHRVFQSERGMLHLRGNRKHLICAYRKFLAFHLKTPSAAKDENGLLVVVTVGKFRSAFLRRP